MLSTVDASTMAITATVLVMVALVFGTVLNAIVGENGFGPTGNAVLFALGCAAGTYLARRQGVDLHDFRLACAYSFGCATILFGAVVLIRAGLARR